MKAILITLLLLLFGYVQPSQGQWIEKQKLLASNGMESDQFGHFVSISEDVALIGSHLDNELGFNAGAAYVYRYNHSSNQWVEEQKLFASNYTTSHQLQFGNYVVASGDLAIVGNRRDDEKGEDAGAVYVFRYDNGQKQWIEEQKLVASNGAAGDHFGENIAISDDVIIVGAFISDDQGENSGAAYAFRFDKQSGTWLEEQKLIPSNAGTFLSFGQSVAVEGNKAIITGNDGAEEPGSAYYFRYNEQTGTWIEKQIIQAGGGLPGARFGTDVSLSGDVLLVGAGNDSAPGMFAGSAYIFRYNGNSDTWEEEQKLLPETSVDFGSFGYAVSVSGDMAVVGHTAGHNYAGEVSVYRYDDSSRDWIREETLLASDREENDQFGISVSLSGNRLLVGANIDDDNGEAAGSAYIFEQAKDAAVTGFTLIDATTDQPIAGFDPIPANAVMNFSLLPRTANIRANTVGHTESVRFSFENKTNFRTENTAPYALYGDYQGDYDEGHLRVGSHTLTATPYAADNASGTAGKASTLNFTVVRQGPSFGIQQLVLVDEATNEDLIVLTDGMVLEISTFPQHPNVRADVVGPVESVRFTLEPQGHAQTENVAPYALFGDHAGDYNPGTFELGYQTLTATAYTNNGAGGKASHPLSITMNVVVSDASARGGKALDNLLLHDVPTEFDLAGAYPNPFNPTTTIRVAVPDAAPVKLLVYDLLGRHVETLVDGTLDAGIHDIRFDAGNLPSGTYLYRLETRAGSFTKRMVLMK